MKAEVKQTCVANAKGELVIDYNGHRFLVIIGEHINGWYIAIPNWNVCVEAGEPSENSYYNGKKLSKALDADMAVAISNAITEYWISNMEKKGVLK